MTTWLRNDDGGVPLAIWQSCILYHTRSSTVSCTASSSEPIEGDDEELATGKAQGFLPLCPSTCFACASFVSDLKVASAISAGVYGFVEDPKFQSTFIKSSDHNHELHADTHLKSHEIVLDWWKTEGKTLTMDNLISNKVRDKRIVDYFTFFAPTGKEMLKLRINMLKEYVDEFVICESNKTQSGNSIQYELRGILKELNLSENNIRIIENLALVHMVKYKIK